MWQCIATRINVSLAAEGRADRIRYLPASAVLAALVERATQGPPLPGITGTGTRGTLDHLFIDTVHLTTLGSYYMTLVTYAAVFERAPVGAWAPQDVSAEAARSLQDFASTFVDSHRKTDRPMSLAQCRSHIYGKFASLYWGYVGKTSSHGEGDPWSAWLKRARLTVQWRYRFWREKPDNPFHYSPETDAGYWLPAP